VERQGHGAVGDALDHEAALVALLDVMELLVQGLA
jgi:hypothetical protein